MYSNVSNMNSSQAFASHHQTEAQGGMLSSRISIRSLVCPISKKFLLDPLRLPSCGHVFDRDAFNQWYLTYKEKICPIVTCSKPYETTKGKEDDDPHRREMAADIKNGMHQPTQDLKNCLNGLFQMLPDSPDKPRIQEAIGVFYMAQLDVGISMMADICSKSTSSKPTIDHLYLPILYLMQNHSQNVAMQINRLIQDANLPAVGNRRDRPVTGLMPITSPILSGIDPQTSMRNMNISLDRNSAFHSLGIGINHQGGNSSSIGTHPPFGSEAFKNSEQGRKRLQAIPAQSEPEQKRMRIEVEKEKKKDGHSSSATEVRAGEDVVIVESVNAPLEDEQSTTSEDDVVSSSENGNEKATTIMPRTTKNQAMQFWIDGIKRGGRLPALRCISNLNEFRDEDGQPLLHLVIIYKSKNTTKAKELIERMVVKMRADINIQNSENETALHLAVKNGKLALIRHLIKLGASNKIKDKEGKCPLDLAPDSKTRKAFD